MQVQEIMTSHVECIRPQDTIMHAAELMRDKDIGSLPVCGNDDRLAGMVTDRDITIRGTAACCEPDKTRVSDVMSQEITYCFEDQDVAEVAHIMEEKQIRRLVVLNRDKRLVGIVSLGDLATKSHDTELSGETLEQISEPVNS